MTAVPVPVPEFRINLTELFEKPKKAKVLVTVVEVLPLRVTTPALVAEVRALRTSKLLWATSRASSPSVADRATKSALGAVVFVKSIDNTLL